MKREQLKKKYPNLQTDEEYDNLNRELSKQRIAKIAISILALAAVILIFFKTTICLSIGIVLGIVAFVLHYFFQSKIDEEFIAKAAKPAASDANLLDQSFITSVINKKFRHSAFNVLFFGFAWLIIWGICEFNMKRPLSFFAIMFCLVPLLIGIIIIFILLCFKNKHIRDIHDGNFIIHCCPVNRKYECSDENSTSYMLEFQTNDYGKFSHSISRYAYLRTKASTDSYYLILLPKRKPGKHKLLAAYPVDEYYVADDMPVSQPR